MGLMKSALLAPEAILLPANFEAYRHYSRLFKSAVASCAPLIEDRGIDEIYIDLSAIAQETRALASSIKQAVTRETGLTCSIGVAPNKLLAKICSDLEKPDGLTVLSVDDIPTRIWPLPVRKINGIGPKANEKLATLGIRTIGELAATDAPELVRHFGRSTGEWLARVARGIDDRPLVTESEPKSISRETTFERDLHARHDRAQLSEIFTQLCVRLAEDLRRKGYSTRTVGVKVKYADFRVLTRDLTLQHDLTNAAEIRKAAGECLKRVPLEQRIRLLGVRLGALHPLGKHRESALQIQADLPF
jgi:DNA polymerase-4